MFTSWVEMVVIWWAWQVPMSLRGVKSSCSLSPDCFWAGFITIRQLMTCCMLITVLWVSSVFDAHTLSMKGSSSFLLSIGTSLHHGGWESANKHMDITIVLFKDCRFISIFTNIWLCLSCVLSDSTSDHFSLSDKDCFGLSVHFYLGAHTVEAHVIKIFIRAVRV